jgi:hypothetical protein
MIDRHILLSIASAAALTLALGTASAETPAAPAGEAAPAPAEAAPAAPAAAPAAGEATAPAGPEAARAAMEKRYAAAMEERAKRYEELRKRAGEIGMTLPETPPWEQSGMPAMPMPPAMPEGMGPDATATQTPMTPEEREEMREKFWEETRARAAEKGVELPETPPWVAAQERRKEMMERYEAYRATIEAMTDEQKEAISALFGNQSRMPMGRQGMPGYGPRCGQPGSCGGWPGYGGMRGPGMMPGYPMMQPAAPDAPEQPAPAE